MFSFHNNAVLLPTVQSMHSTHYQIRSKKNVARGFNFIYILPELGSICWLGVLVMWILNVELFACWCEICVHACADLIAHWMSHTQLNKQVSDHSYISSATIQPMSVLFGDHCLIFSLLSFSYSMQSCGIRAILSLELQFFWDFRAHLPQFLLLMIDNLFSFVEFVLSLIEAVLKAYQKHFRYLWMVNAQLQLLTSRLLQRVILCLFNWSDVN